MKFRLQRAAGPVCTSIDHIYPQGTRGSFCQCEQRRYGIEPPRRAVAVLDARGRVYRPVRRVIRRQAPNERHDDWVVVCSLRGCGHLEVKRSESAAMWVGVKIRCRMCERVFRELQEETDRVQRKAAKKRKQEMAWIRHQMSKKRLVIRRLRRRGAIGAE